MARQYLTEDDICQLLVDKVSMERFSTDEEDIMWDELKKIEGFQSYLTNTMVKDKDRYFGATTPMEQLMTKGAFNRTMYIRSKLREKKEVKLDNPRYE